MKIEGLKEVLKNWVKELKEIYVSPVYLVGSAIRKNNPRDIDIIVVLRDEVFRANYGSVKEWKQEGESGEWSEVRWRWSEDCVENCKRGQRVTKLNIDFKVMPEKYADLRESICLS